MTIDIDKYAQIIVDGLVSADQQIPSDDVEFVSAQLYSFSLAVIAAEREACAQVAESFIPSGFTSDGKAGNTYATARDDRARTIAAAIRARSEGGQG